MKARLAATLCTLCALGAMLSCSSTGPSVVVPPKEPEKVAFSEIGTHVLPDKRLVELSADVVVSDIPDKAKKVQVWVPMPFGSPVQTIMEPIVESPVAYRPIIRMDAAYSGPSIFLIVEEPLQKEEDRSVPLPKEVRLRWTAQVERARRNASGAREAAPPSEESLRREFAAELRPPASLEPGELAAALAAVPAENVSRTPDAVKGPGPIFRARAIYDYVVGAFEPDDTLGARPLKEVLASRRGGALDYASVTVALMRAAGIPARIEAGVILDENRSPDLAPATTRGAWVGFYDAGGAGWTACDPYRADRFPELKDYLFAGLDANRVQMAVGPEPGLLPPPAAGAPLVLDGVIAEADGKPVTVKMTLMFRDVCPK